MKNVVFVVMLCLATLCLAQPPTPEPPPPPPPPQIQIPQFSITGNIMSLSGQGQTVAAALVGGELQITDNYYFRSTNIMAPSVANTDNLAGVNYLLSNKWISKTKLPAEHLRPYLTGSLGIARTGSAPVNHFAAMFGGGMKYCVGGLCATVAEIQWAHFPGFNNSTVVVSSGLSLGWHW